MALEPTIVNPPRRVMTASRSASDEPDSLTFTNWSVVEQRRLVLEPQTSTRPVRDTFATLSSRLASMSVAHGSVWFGAMSCAPVTLAFSRASDDRVLHAFGDGPHLRGEHLGGEVDDVEGELLVRDVQQRVDVLSRTTGTLVSVRCRP
jgi:hypothetical protein